MRMLPFPTCYIPGISSQLHVEGEPCTIMYQINFSPECFCILSEAEDRFSGSQLRGLQVAPLCITAETSVPAGLRGLRRCCGDGELLHAPL